MGQERPGLEGLKRRLENYGCLDVLSEVLSEILQRHLHRRRLTLLDVCLVDQINRTLLASEPEAVELALIVLEHLAAADQQDLPAPLDTELLLDGRGQRAHTLQSNKV